MLRTPRLSYALANAASSVRLLAPPPRLMLTTFALLAVQEFKAFTRFDEYVQLQAPSSTSESFPNTLTMWSDTPGLAPTTPVALPVTAATVPATWLPWPQLSLFQAPE